MSDMTDERIIEVLRKEGREYRQEIKGLKDMEDFRVSIIKALKESRDEILGVAKELFINRKCAPMPRWKKVIDEAQALKEKEVWK